MFDPRAATSQVPTLCLHSTHLSVPKQSWVDIAMLGQRSLRFLFFLLAPLRGAIFLEVLKCFGSSLELQPWDKIDFSWFTRWLSILTSVDFDIKLANSSNPYRWTAVIPAALHFKPQAHFPQERRPGKCCPSDWVEQIGMSSCLVKQMGEGEEIPASFPLDGVYWLHSCVLVRGPFLF